MLFGIHHNNCLNMTFHNHLCILLYSYLHIRLHIFSHNHLYKYHNIHPCTNTLND